ncbi:hypothetical protein NL108_004931 [Boleophthalmus pectinirostris]|nr:hypothetical protein NL108_004931 [Boleophthalmus pectinirostris]
MMTVVTTVMIEWLPEKKRGIGAEDDGDTDSQDADSEDDEEQDAEDGQHDQEAMEDGHMTPDHIQARKNTWKVQDNDFDGVLPAFLGEWKLNVEGRDPIDFFRHLFPADHIDDIVHNTSLYGLQKGKENLAVTREEIFRDQSDHGVHSVS